MLRLLRISLLLFLLSGALAEPRAETRYFLFRVTWEFIPVGRIELWRSEQETVAYARTTGLGALIFPFRSLWRTVLDPKGYPRKTEIEILERNHPKRKILRFEPEKGLVIKEKITPRKHVRETFRVRYPLYDELTAFWATLAFPWKGPGDRMALPVFARGKVHRVSIVAKRLKEIKSFRGWERALEIEALLPFESELIKRSRNMKLYLSPEGWPLIGEGDIPLGHLKVYLEKALAGGDAPPPPEGLLHSTLKVLD